MYAVVGAALKEIVVKKQSLKNAVYKATKGKPAEVIKGTMAITAKLKDRLKELERLLKAKSLSSKISRSTSFFTAMAMVGDHMISVKGIKGGGALKRKILEGLESSGFAEPGAWADDITTTQPRNSAAPLHRFLRVDLHRLSRRRAVHQLSSDFGISADHIQLDSILENVIWVPPDISSKLRDHKLIQNGTLTMMDRSACLSALAVKIEPNDTILDICAAPGSKTLSFLSQLRGRGLVVAIEKNVDRFTTLPKRIISESICTEELEINEDENIALPVKNMSMRVLRSPDGGMVVVMMCVSFYLLTSCRSSHGDCECGEKLCLNSIVDRFQPESVVSRRGKVIVSVDPSCSGSGLPEHCADNSGPCETAVRSRVESLSLFQKSILVHALDLKIADICLYSTCSVWAEENEQIVRSVLRSNEWKLRRDLEKWLNSDLQFLKKPNDDVLATAAMCYRSDLKTHGCRGFFLAVFYRV